MGMIEQRAAKRIECDFPLRLVSDLQTIDAVACDVSRTGIRVRIPGRALGVHRLSSLVEIARRVSNMLGEVFVADFHPDRLGGLVRKTLHPIRIGQRDWESADVELGCQIPEGLCDDIAGMLGLLLPREGEEEAPPELKGAEPVVREVPVHESHPEPAEEPEPVAEVEESFDLVGKRVSENWRAYVTGKTETGRSVFVASTEGVTAHGAVLRIHDISRLELDGNVDDVSRFVVSFCEAYGESVTLRVMDGARHVWSGPAKLREAEFPPENPGQALLTVAFARELRLAEQRELGLV